MFLNSHNISPSPGFRRIICLVPSITELLSDFGLDNEVVGITKFCVRPHDWFKNKTRIGGTKNVNMREINKLKPDLIIANKEENERVQVEELAKSYNVFLTEVDNLQAALEMIFQVGLLTNREEQSSQIGRGIDHEFRQLRDRYDSEKKTKAAYFIWQNPYMVAGGDTFINSMMKWCGYENVFADKLRYPQILLEDVREKKCDTILLSSEPFPFKEKHKMELESILPGIAVKLVDGEMFSWYGSRLIQAAPYFKSINSS